MEFYGAGLAPRRTEFIHKTENFIWYEDNLLGSGATSKVYKGFKKEDGVAVAVKAFYQGCEEKFRRREMEALQKLKHKNIVKLLAIEEHTHLGEVIVMELCTNGNLRKNLQDPENAFGLHEDEFLVLLEDVTAGMKRLRDINLIHRDVKADNILKFIAADGSVVYKLSDFGTAKELDEEEQFDSICGTHEYLFPDIYEVGVMRRKKKSDFSAKADLWTLGVTFYYAATGSLPFRPLCGRNDKKTMLMLTKEGKKSGEISAHETTDGPIIRSRELPDSCKLSQSLKMLLTPILAKLLEANTNQLWTFNEFFESVAKINEAKRSQIWCWDVLSCQMHRIYPIDKDFKVDHLRIEIEKLSSISPQDQLLLYEDIEVNDKNWQVVTKKKKPLNLFHLQNEKDENVPVKVEEMPEYPPSSMEENRLKKDADDSKNCCKIAYCVKRQIEDFSLAAKLSYKAYKCLSKLIEREAAEVNLQKIHALQLADVIKGRAQAILKTHVFIPKLNLTDNEQTSDEHCECLNEVLQIHSELGKFSLALPHLNGDDLRKEWLSQAVDFGVKKANEVSLKSSALRDIWMDMVGGKKRGSLSDSHDLQKLQIANNSTKEIVDLMADQMKPCATELAKCVAQWYNLARPSYISAKILKQKIAESHSRLMQIQETLEKLEDKFLRNTAEAQEAFSNNRALLEEELGSPNLSISSVVRLAKNRSCRQTLADVLAVQDEIEQILIGNSELVSEIETLAQAFSNRNLNN